MSFLPALFAVAKTVFAKKAVQQIGANLAVAAFQSAQQKKANAAAQSYARNVLTEQRAYDRDTLLRVREDAEKAGFNPLTALRNGAASIGSNTYLNAPALSSNDFIGQALMGAIDTGFNAPQRELDRETQRLQNDLYRAQIGELQANTNHLRSSYGFGIPAVEEYMSGYLTNGQPRLSRTGRDPYRDPFMVNGMEVIEDPDWSDASRAEQRSGELGEFIQGAGTFIADSVATRDHYRRLSRLSVNPQNQFDTGRVPALANLPLIYGIGR